MSETDAALPVSVRSGPHLKTSLKPGRRTHDKKCLWPVQCLEQLLGNPPDYTSVGDHVAWLETAEAYTTQLSYFY